MCWYEKQIVQHTKKRKMKEVMAMTVVKVAELVGSSKNSWQEAAQAAVSEAQRSYPNITGVEVLNMTAEVQDGSIVEYKADVQVAYVE